VTTTEREPGAELVVPPEHHVTRGGLGADHPHPDEPEPVGEPAVPVDPPKQAVTLYATALAARNADRRPIVPAWARSRAEARALAGWLVRYGLHVTGYHLTRTPKYVLKLAWWAPRGAWVGVRRVIAWLFDAEAAPLRLGAVVRNDVKEYLTLAKRRDTRLRHRTMTLLAATLATGVALTLAHWWVPWWICWLLAPTVAVAALGRLGTPRDRRITDVATVSSSAPPRLTADVVTRALRSLGVAALNGKGDDPITYVAPITRDGPGWRAEGDLAYGVTVVDVVEKRRELSSGLRRPLGCVWPEVRSDQHEGRLVLWVGDQDMSRAKPVEWPFAKRGVTNLFGEIPFGVDPRGRGISMTLMFESVLVGAKPRMGKTAALRVLACAAALDPSARLRIFELKGTGDLGPLEGCCHQYASGADEESIEACMGALRDLYETELNTRAATIRKLPSDICPDSKVTPELSARRALRLFPDVLIIDECQELFTNEKCGQEAARLCEAIIKRGPALGIIPIFATQRPDAKSLPTGVSANAGIRFCLRVMGQIENDMVLGTSSYKNGIRATTFTARDRGIGYLVGVGDDPMIVRTAYIDKPAAERIAARARAVRENAGALSGHALGEVPEPSRERVDVLADLAAVLRGDEKAWTDAVLAMLAELRPAVYGTWNPRALSAAVKPYGIRPAQVWQDGENKQGYTREQVAEAMARRELESAR
jgi:S-DNA-T family DNA segregation ATPase FtsK/SpoIIIE